MREGTRREGDARACYSIMCIRTRSEPKRWFPCIRFSPLLPALFLPLPALFLPLMHSLLSLATCPLPPSLPPPPFPSSLSRSLSMIRRASRKQLMPNSAIFSEFSENGSRQTTRMIKKERNHSLHRRRTSKSLRRAWRSGRRRSDGCGNWFQRLSTTRRSQSWPEGTTRIDMLADILEEQG